MLESLEELDQFKLADVSSFLGEELAKFDFEIAGVDA